MAKSASTIRVILLLIVPTAVLFFQRPPGPLRANTETVLDEYMFLQTDIISLNIFATNLIVGLLIAYGGFFTAGILTLFIWIWNGVIVYILYSTVISSGADSGLILYASKHFVLEIYAFYLFSKISFRGLDFYKHLLYENKITESLIPRGKELLKPMFVLILSSIIEVL